jgi:excisionase family DNA binding protein
MMTTITNFPLFHFSDDKRIFPMGATDESTEYLKIDEAARLLRVTRRTVYRRIWSGELPATKVGGLYLIRRGDLEAMLSQGRVTSPGDVARPEVASPTIKCGNCFRLLGSEVQIGDICQAEGCDRVICVDCQKEGFQFCFQHMPNHKQKVDDAVRSYMQGETPVLVKGNTARLREVNFLNRIQDRISRIGSLIHPMSGEIINIQNWDRVREENDQRAEVMRFLGKVMLDTETLSNTPLNAYVCYRLEHQKQPDSLPLEILIQTLSRLRVMVDDGVDTEPLTMEDLSPWLLQLSEEAQKNQIFRFVVLASTTGWDSTARQLIEGRLKGEAFAHRLVLFYLYDLEEGELIYNLKDDRASQYAELFKPLLPSEELEEISQAIERELLVYESITLDYATQVLPYSQELVREAFSRLVSSNKFSLIELPDLGLVLLRKS